MNIRPATKEDADKVFALGKGQSEFSTENGSFWSVEQLTCWFSSDEDITLVAEKEGVVVGFSLWATHKPTGKITWENLYIDPQQRGSGIGRALILEGHKRLKEKGYMYIALQNNNDDQERFAEYLEKFGFKRGDKVLWMDQLL